MEQLDKRTMNRTHKLKIFKENADNIFEGKKTFEIVENTKNFQEGDVVIFTGFDYSEHPINLIAYEITYVVSGLNSMGYGLKNDYVALGLKRLE